MIKIDSLSHQVWVDATVSAEALEAHLQQQGYSSGYYSPEFQTQSLREILSKKIQNLYHLIYGQIQDLCVALCFLDGRELLYETYPVPKQATGPSFKNLLIGAEDKLGHIARICLRIFPFYSYVRHSVIELPDLESGFVLERKLYAREIHPFCFGRFAKESLPDFLQEGLKSGSLALLLEWRGLPALIDAEISELNRFLGKTYFHRLFQDEAGSQKIQELLRKKTPFPAWRNLPLHSTSPQLEKLKQEWMDKLCKPKR